MIATPLTWVSLIGLRACAVRAGLVSRRTIRGRVASDWVGLGVSWVGVGLGVGCVSGVRVEVEVEVGMGM